MFMGGAGKQLALTASSLVDRGHEVYLYTYVGASLEHRIDSRIIYIAEKNVPTSKLKEYLFTPFHIHRVINQVKPDIAISWRANAGCMLVLGAIGTGISTVFSERSDPYMETNMMLKIATKICDYSDGGVFQTSKARDYYHHLSSKSVVIPNPVGLDLKFPKIENIESRKKEIAWVGRIANKQKRMDIALKAFQIIHKQLPDYTLSFYGDGVDIQWIKKMVADLHLQNYVFFHGAKKDIIDIIKYSRILVLSSDYEGIPNIIIEAFIAGTPVVATDCSPGGARLLIDNERNGFVVPMRDYKALAAQCVKVIEDPKLSNSFIQQSRTKLKLFEPQGIFKAWNEYLMKIGGGNHFMKESN